MAESERLGGSSEATRLTLEEQHRGLCALAELERLSAEIASRHGKLIPESWELINQSRDERTRDLSQAAGG